MKPVEVHIAEAIPGRSFADRKLRSQIISITHASERLQTQVDSLGHAVADFLSRGAIDDAYSTDVLLEELGMTADIVLGSMREIENCRGQIAILQMDRICAARNE